MQSADAAEARSAISAAKASAVSALSSNALVLGPINWDRKTVTWSSNQTLTYTGGSSVANDGVVIVANVTTLMVLTINFTTATVYRNGAVSALSTTITVPTGKHRFTFWTPDTGSTIYMEDTVTALGDPPSGAQAGSLIMRALGGSCAAQSIDVSQISTATTMTNGRLLLQPLWLPTETVLTGIRWYQRVAGNYTGDSFNGIALFTENAGTLTQVAISANTANCWTASADTYGSLAFTSTYAAPAGLYYAAALYHNSAQTTAPSLGSGPAVVAYQVYQGAVTNKPLAGYLNSQTSMPSSVTLSALSGVPTSPIWLSIY